AIPRRLLAGPLTSGFRTRGASGGPYVTVALRGLREQAPPFYPLYKAKGQGEGAVTAPSPCPTRGSNPTSGLQAVGDVVEGVGDRGLQELQGHDHQDGDEGQDEGILYHALALFGALTQLGHQGLRRHDLLGYELAHVFLTFSCDSSAGRFRRLRR